MKNERIFHLVFFAVTFFLLTSWNKTLPTLFLIGDSISLQYGPSLEKYLRGIVIFERKQDDGQAEKNLDVPIGPNGGDSRMVLAYLKTRVTDPGFKPDYLLLNCGLHDIKRIPSTNQIQVNEKEYGENLEAIVKLLRRHKIRLIWMRTTAVVDSIHNGKQRSFHRYAADLETYNRIADEICVQNRIPVIDLYGFTRKLGVEQFTDHVHYKEPARDLQAAYIAGNISCILNKFQKSLK